MMKRITITLEEDMYLQLLEYALEKSKAELRNYSMSEAIRDLLAMQLQRTEVRQSRETEEWVRSHTADRDHGSSARSG